MTNPFESGTHKREISGLTASGAAHEGRGCPSGQHVFSCPIFSLLSPSARPFHKRSAQDNFRMMQCPTYHATVTQCVILVCWDGGICEGMKCLYKSSSRHSESRKPAASTPHYIPRILEFSRPLRQSNNPDLGTSGPSRTNASPGTSARSSPADRGTACMTCTTGTGPHRSVQESG